MKQRLMPYKVIGWMVNAGLPADYCREVMKGRGVRGSLKLLAKMKAWDREKKKVAAGNLWLFN